MIFSKMRLFKSLVLTLTVLLASTSFYSCRQGENSGSNTSANDTTAKADSATQPALKADEGINRATRFYAGISKEGINMSSADEQAWDKYSKEIKSLIEISNKTRSQVDSLAKADFSDFRDKVDVVFYPFSGADFLYPTTIFPDADTYILCGLEKLGSPFGENIKTTYAHYESYRKALSYFLRVSYFITKDMQNDFHNDELDGVCPVITMLMATAGYDIISIEKKDLDENGGLIPAKDKGQVMQYKFFRHGTNHEQTLYFYSGNVQNTALNPNYKKFIEKSLASHTVASYFKAASYILQSSGFSDIRDYALNYSKYIIQDDSGIPYRNLTDKFDITLYGAYKHPLQVFGNYAYQEDLNQAYQNKAASIHRLPFRIGYNNPSNWLCARRKAESSN